MQNSNQEGVSFGYARRRDPSVTDPTTRYKEQKGRYYPIGMHIRYKKGDRVRVLADRGEHFGRHMYSIGRILVITSENHYREGHRNPIGFYYNIENGVNVIPGDELEPA